MQQISSGGQPEPRILAAERAFVVCCKMPGTECERELPAWLAARLGAETETIRCVLWLVMSRPS